MEQSVKMEDEPADHCSQPTDHQLGTSNVQTVSNLQTFPRTKRRPETGDGNRKRETGLYCQPIYLSLFTISGEQSVKLEDKPADHCSQSTDHQLGTSNVQTVSNLQTLRLSPEPKGERRREKGDRTKKLMIFE
ncbi:hypothetical protein DET65_2587 [Sunxiuqinia elliptica]|uniref:Uncharacterized protein n=1 Tax=Sunxiuqinia elliptica TaxID=655355 RepID=A0A4R6H6M4_9BACT|nr:hypothetical protein DET52_10344 [Sunxiuqinia elliptica]TDO59304.1 hypothetical protein DET65_2587 [Sunxiuqinia elliptica]